MNLFFWVVLLGVISVLLAFISYKREQSRHDLKKAKEEISKGRVIFHSSSDGESSS